MSFGSQQPTDQDTKSDRVQQISQQIIYGNVTNAVAGGQGSTISIAVQRGDTKSLVDYLTESGLPNDDAAEIANIMETEDPISIEEPFGIKARDWIASNLWKAAKGTWSIGVSVATRILSEAALKYYGFK